MYVAETVNFNVWLCAGGGSGEAVDTSHPRPQTTGSRTAHTQNTSRHFVIRTDNGLRQSSSPSISSSGSMVATESFGFLLVI